MLNWRIPFFICIGRWSNLMLWSDSNFLWANSPKKTSQAVTQETNSYLFLLNADRSCWAIHSSNASKNKAASLAGWTSRSFASAARWVTHHLTEDVAPSAASEKSLPFHRRAWPRSALSLRPRCRRFVPQGGAGSRPASRIRLSWGNRRGKIFQAYLLCSKAWDDRWPNSGSRKSRPKCEKLNVFTLYTQ